MSDKTGFDAYKNSNVEVQAAASSPIEQVLMLVNGFIDEIDRVEGHIGAKNDERKTQSVARCMRLLDGLDASLDMEKGGALAQQLRDYYNFMGTQVYDASVKNDVEMLGPVREVMKNLKEGWEGIAQSAA
jgi:flagellar protein FliS